MSGVSSVRIQCLTLKVRLVSSVGSIPDHHACRMNHHLPAAPQPGLGLPRAAAVLQPKGEPVVMATEADQKPLPDVDPLAGEPQGLSAVAEVGTNGEVTLRDLRDKTHIRMLKL